MNALAIRTIAALLPLTAVAGSRPSSADDQFDLVRYEALPIDMGIGGRDPFVIDRHSGAVVTAHPLVSSRRCSNLPGVCFHTLHGPIAIPDCFSSDDEWKWSGGGVVAERRGSPFAAEFFDRKLDLVRLSITDGSESTTLLLVDRELGAVAMTFNSGTADALGPYVLSSETGLGAGQTCAGAAAGRSE